MAEVFLGMVSGEGGFRKYVAIKRILPHLTEEKDFINMFFDEARLMARFNHPHIVQIYDLGRVKNTYFLAMEFVSGLTMFRLINRYAKLKKLIPVEITARIVADVCDALDYAHNFTSPDGTPLEIVHRDVSAQNIMLSTEGVVKVLDFGVAKAVGNLSRTRPSWLKGKALYMSPEQIEMKPIDRRSDIFSVGTLLYIMSTMHRPFQGESEYQVMMSIVNQPAPDPRDFNPNIPEALVRIIEKALQKDPGARYQTAHEMQQDLEKFLEERKARVTNRTLATFLTTVVPQLAEKGAKVMRAPTQKLPAPMPSTPAIATSKPPTGEHPVLLIPKEKTLNEPVLLKNKKTPTSEQLIPAEILEVSDSLPNLPGTPVPAKVATPVSKPVLPKAGAVATPVKAGVPQASISPAASTPSPSAASSEALASEVQTAPPTPPQPLPAPASNTGVPFKNLTQQPPRMRFLWWIVTGLAVAVVAVVLLYAVFSGQPEKSPSLPEPIPSAEPAAKPPEAAAPPEPPKTEPPPPEAPAAGEQVATGPTPAPSEQQMAPAVAPPPAKQETASGAKPLPAESIVAMPEKPLAAPPPKPKTTPAAATPKTKPVYQPQIQPIDETPAAAASAQEAKASLPKEPTDTESIPSPPPAESATEKKDEPTPTTPPAPAPVANQPSTEAAPPAAAPQAPPAESNEVAVAPVAAGPREPIFQTSARMLARRLEGSEPEYPRIARQARIEATLVARIDVSPEGRVTAIRFLKTHEAFEKVVREAVERWRFSPFMLKGEAVPTYTVYKFVFKLE